MSSSVKAVTWDCSDPIRLGRFWAAALGTDMDEDSTDERAYVEGFRLGAAEVRRFDSHVVMQDPEGNEFCVEPGPEDADG